MRARTIITLHTEVDIFVLCQAGNVWIESREGVIIKFNSTQPYFMTYCIESLPQPFSNCKYNWRRRDLNPGSSEYQSNALPTELS